MYAHPVPAPVPAPDGADADPHAVAAALMERLLGFIVTQAVATATAEGLFDLLAAGPRSLGDLAKSSGTDPDRLRQMLRCLTQVQILAEPEPDVFAPTALSRGLESDNPHSLAPYVTFTRDYFYPAGAYLPDVVRDGEAGSAFRRAHGASFFDVLRDDPVAGAGFDDAMAATSVGLAEAVAAQCGDARTVVDVGGGNGALLATVLQRHPGARGVLAEQPHVLPAAEARLAAEGLAGRCDLVPCDFFADVPRGGDVYVLARILHDWSDDRARAVLRNVRRAMGDDARLLIVDRVVTDHRERHWDKLYDMMISLLLTGHERTRDQWEQLLAGEGLALRGVTTAGWRSHLLSVTP